MIPISTLNMRHMFQSFEDPSASNDTAARIAQLREIMRAEKIDAYLVPRADEHQGEYVPPQSERLQWLTGFSGSAGLAVIAKKKAALFVDGRYTLQAQKEVDNKIFEFFEIPKSKVSDWIGKNLTKNSIVGFDPKLHTVTDILRLEPALKKHEIKLRPIARSNLIDRIWDKTDHTSDIEKISIHPVKFAGQKHVDKLAQIQTTLKNANHDAAILTMPDSISWLLNIRGRDVAHNPVVLAFAIIPTKGKCELFIEPKKLSPEMRQHLKPVAKIYTPDDLAQRISVLKSTEKRIRIDPDSAAHWFATHLRKNQVAHAPDPCLEPKTIKNGTEITGAREAHIRDGAAIVRFLHWLDKSVEPKTTT